MLSLNKFNLYRKYREDFWGFLSITKNNKYTPMIEYVGESFYLNFFYRSAIRLRKRFFRNKFHFKKKKKEEFFYEYNPEEKLEIKFKRYSYRSLSELNFRKMKIFYGNLKKKNIKSLYFLKKKKKLIYGYSLFFLLESRILVVLYRLNLFDNIATIKQFIKFKNILLNNQLVQNYNLNLKLFDILSLSKNNHLKYYKKLLLNLKKKNILQNYPNYLEVNYKVMSCIFFRLPKKKDIRFPFKVNLDSFLSKLN